MMKNSLKRFTAVLTCTALTAALALPARAAEDQPIRVGSYKGTMLEVGERSGLVIGPGGSACTVTSSRGNRDPDADRWLPRSAGSHRREWPRPRRGVGCAAGAGTAGQ